MKKFNIYDNKGLIKANLARVVVENHFDVSHSQLVLSVDRVLDTLDAEDLHHEMQVAFDEKGKKGVSSRVLYRVCQRILDEHYAQDFSTLALSDNYDKYSKNYKYTIYCDHLVKLLSGIKDNKREVEVELDYLCDNAYVDYLDIDKVIDSKAVGFDTEEDALRFAQSMLQEFRTYMVAIYDEGKYSRSIIRA